MDKAVNEEGNLILTDLSLPSGKQIDIELADAPETGDLADFLTVISLLSLVGMGVLNRREDQEA